MKLHWSPRSPFVRKVMIVLHETGLVEEVELVRSVVAMHLPPNKEVLVDNPLGKIPVLVTDEGEALFDSRVICEYLDQVAGTNLFPKGPRARMQQLRWQALADGLTDILLLWRTELTSMPVPRQAITDGWKLKVRGALARLETEASELNEAPFGIGHVAILCALGQLDFRWPDCRWRDHFPALARVEKTLCQRASVGATVVVNDEDAAANDVTLGQLRFDN